MSFDSGLWATLAVALPLLAAAPFVAAAVYIVVRLVKASTERSALLATGEAAQAVILAAEDTGITVNDSPRVKLTLEVRPAHGAPYRATATMLVGRLQVGMLAPGTPVSVKFDPADPNRVAVESFGATAEPYRAAAVSFDTAGSPLLGTVARRAHDELLSREVSFEKLRRTGEGAPARILNLMDTGIRIGDGASMLRFGLEVLPTGRPAFRAETQCAVSDVSRAKFVPGATVNVKFGIHGSPMVAVDYAP
ncbi:MAG TPA: DUF3592 domain-containing protein [Pyrinomonadaceae bacterium]